MGGASEGCRDRGRRGGVPGGVGRGRRCLEDGRSTFHKGSSDPGSKSRKVAEGRVPDVKGRSAGVVTCRRRRSIAIGRVRSRAISSWRRRGNVTGVAAIKVDSKVGSREGAYDSLNGGGGGFVGDCGQYPTKTEVVEEVERLPADVKDESSHLSVDFGPGTRSFRVEVAECDIGAKEGYCIL